MTPPVRSTTGAELPTLVSALLGAHPERAVVRPELLHGFEAQLAAIRHSEPVVDWCGVNERRVDVMVTTRDDQYRIVYFTTDGRIIEALSVFRRPARFDGLEGGRAVLVNGPSGSGKSSLLTAIAAASDAPWVLFDEPVIGAVRQEYLIWRDRAPSLHVGFLDAIAALARRGNLVALSVAGHPAPAIDAAFVGVTVVRVGLDCELQTLLERERGREERWGGLAADSVSAHEGWRYDARFDTGRLPAATIAEDVLRLLNA
jgi:chloramphenicol 3-O-phosphotransferase